MIILFHFFSYCSLPIQDLMYQWWPDARPTQYIDWRAEVLYTQQLLELTELHDNTRGLLFTEYVN